MISSTKIEHQRELYRRSSQPQERLAAGLALADLLIDDNNNDGALAVLAELGPLCRDGRQAGAVLRRNGEAHFRRSEFDLAIQKLDQAQASLAGEAASLEQFYVYRNFTWVYSRQGYMDKTREFCEKAKNVLSAVEGATQEEMNLAQGSYIHMVAMLEGAAGNKEAAIKHYLEEIEILAHTGGRSKLAPAYINLANIYYTKGRIAKCLKYQLMAKDILEEAGNRYTLSVVYNNIGELYWSLGVLEKSQEYYDYHMDVTRICENRLSDVLAYSGMARVAMGQGDIPRAEALYLTALRVAQEVGSPGKEAIILGELADLYAEWGKFGPALARLDDAERLVAEIHNCNSPRYSIIRAKVLVRKAEAEAGGEQRASLDQAKVLLEEALAQPMRLPSEEVVSATELAIQAHYFLALAGSLLEDQPAAEAHILQCLRHID